MIESYRRCSFDYAYNKLCNMTSTAGSSEERDALKELKVFVRRTQRGVTPHDLEHFTLLWHKYEELINPPALADLCFDDPRPEWERDRQAALKLKWGHLTVDRRTK